MKPYITPEESWLESSYEAARWARGFFRGYIDEYSYPHINQVHWELDEPLELSLIDDIWNDLGER